MTFKKLRHEWSLYCTDEIKKQTFEAYKITQFACILITRFNPAFGLLNKLW